MPTASELGRDFITAIDALPDVLLHVIERFRWFEELRGQVIARRQAGDHPNEADAPVFVRLHIRRHKQLEAAARRGENVETDPWAPRSDWAELFYQASMCAAEIRDLIEIANAHVETCRDVLAGGVHHLRPSPFHELHSRLTRLASIVEPRVFGVTRDGFFADEVEELAPDTSEVISAIEKMCSDIESTSEWPPPAEIVPDAGKYVYPNARRLFVGISDCWISGGELGQSLREVQRIVGLVDKSKEVYRSYRRARVGAPRVGQMFEEERVRMVWEPMDEYCVARDTFMRARLRMIDHCARARAELAATEKTTGLTADHFLKHLGRAGEFLPNHQLAGDHAPLEPATAEAAVRWADRLNELGEEIRHIAFARAVPSSPPVNEPSPPAAAPTAVFKREGEVGRVHYAGQTGTYRDTVGMRHLARLLSLPHPTRAMEALEVHDVDPQRAGAASSFDPATDKDYQDELRRALREVDEKIEDAIARGDEQAQLTAQREKERILEQSAKDAGLGSRVRSIGQRGPAEAARVAVRQALSRCYSVFRAASPPMDLLADHLEGSIEIRQSTLAYRPVPPAPDWDLG